MISDDNLYLIFYTAIFLAFISNLQYTYALIQAMNLPKPAAMNYFKYFHTISIPFDSLRHK